MKTLLYCVFWKKNEVGRIFEKDGKFKYIPNFIELEMMEDAPMNILGNPQFKWGEMPAFFNERLALEQQPDNITITKVI